MQLKLIGYCDILKTVELHLLSFYFYKFLFRFSEHKNR